MPEKEAKIPYLMQDAIVLVIIILVVFYRHCKIVSELNLECVPYVFLSKLKVRTFLWGTEHIQPNANRTYVRE